MIRMISGFIFSLIMLAFSVSASASLVAYWNFDETSGTVAHDSAGSYNGNLHGSASWSPSGGIAGGAISLNRTTNDYVDMGNVLPFNSGDFSIVAWVKTSTTSDNTFVLSRHRSGTWNGYFIGVNKSGSYGQSNKAYFYDATSPGNCPVSTTDVNDDAWHQIVAVHDADGLSKIYVDGIPYEDNKNSQTPIYNSASHFLIGGITVDTGPASYFDGLIDDVRIYDQVLTDAQINDLYQNTVSPVPIPGAAWLLGSALLGLVAVRRRKNKI